MKAADESVVLVPVWLLRSVILADSYGVGMALARITRAIMSNQKVTLPISTLLRGEYGHEDIYIGVPASLGRRGVREVRDLDLDEHEQKLFDASVAHLREAMESVDL